MKRLQQIIRFGSPMYLAATFLLAIGSARSQSDLERTLMQYSANDVKGYIQPIADLFGANMNAGYYHSAAIPVAGFHLGIDIVGMGALVSDDQKTYAANAPVGFNPATFQTATVFGGKGTVATDASTGFTYRGSDGIINASIFPLAVPQVSIGYFYGTVVTARFITTPSFSNDKFPKTTLWALGARHGISQYLPGAPLDIAAGVFYSSFTVGDIIDFTGLSIGAQASKSFAVLNLYGGVAWEKSTMNLKYTPSNSATPAVNIDLDGDNAFRITVGAGLALGFFNIFADANIGSITNFSGGIGLGF